MGRIIYGILLGLLISHTAFADQYDAEVTIDEHDKREIVLRLEELKLAREKIALQQQYIDRDREQDRRESELAAQKTSLVEQERDLWKEKAEHYETLYRSLTKGRSKGCWITKIFTFGIANCH